LLQDQRTVQSIQDINGRIAREWDPYNQQRHQIILGLFDNTRQRFLAAAQYGFRESVENYICQHQHDAGFRELATLAAQMAQENEQDDMASLLTQLVISDEPAPLQPPPMLEATLDPAFYQAQLNDIGFNFVDLPVQFRDPVTLEIMEDPVVISSGKALDRSTLNRLFQDGNPRCPLTRAPIRAEEGNNKTCQFIKDEIESFISIKIAAYRSTVKLRPTSRHVCNI